MREQARHLAPLVLVVAIWLLGCEESGALSPDTDSDSFGKGDMDDDPGGEIDTFTFNDSDSKEAGTDTDTYQTSSDDSDTDDTSDDTDSDTETLPSVDCGGLDGYEGVWVRLWPVCVSDELTEANPDLGEAVLAALDEDLGIIVEALPEAAVTFLRTVRIWVELDVPAFPGGVYHPSQGWLSSNGYPTQWAGGVQLGNASNYMTWVNQQPAMVLHELAHAYHHQYLGYDDPTIQSAYDAAMASGIYESVQHVVGGYQKAYAATNTQEYFAELTEAYFWTNDFYPFERADLEAFDQQGYLAIESSWLDQ